MKRSSTELRHAQADALAVYAGQLVSVRCCQGRLFEVETTLRAALDQPPMNQSTRPLVAEVLADIGDRTPARSLLREELDTSVASSPGQYWLPVVCAWASVAARVGDAEAAEHLRDLLDPNVDLVYFNGAWVVGSVALFHGLLVHALGNRRGRGGRAPNCTPNARTPRHAIARGAHRGDDGSCADEDAPNRCSVASRCPVPSVSDQIGP